MTKDEALKLALEALEANQPVNYCMNSNGERFPMMQKDPFRFERNTKALTAIKEALANEALEKMAENARELGLDYEPEQDWIERERAVGYREGHQNALKQMAQPEQEPIGQLCEESYGRGQVMWFNKPVDGSYVYTTPPQGIYYIPPQRTWVGLTDGEVDKMILLMGFPPDWITENAIVKNIVRNLEAKLKEKNS